MYRPLILAIALITSFLPSPGAFAQDDLRKSIVFRATFDDSFDAQVAGGDAKIYTAESLARKKVTAGLHAGDAVVLQPNAGRSGGCLRFRTKTKKLIFFKGEGNVLWDKSSFSGTVSFWMKLSPRHDLPKGSFVDPLQITDKKWNDASFFVDFDKEETRDFRLGAFSDYAFWNPTDRKFDDIPLKERPMVFVRNPPFDRTKWTHVAFTWSNFNTGEPATATLYLNGKLQGTLKTRQQFTWDPASTVIMLGINYVGWLDDLIVLDRACSADEITDLM